MADDLYDRPGVRSLAARASAPPGVAHETFTALMATHEPTIARYLRHLVGDVEVARDLTQETFLSAYRTWGADLPANPGGWLYRVATNHAFAHFRRRRLISWLPLGARLVARQESPEMAVAGDAAVATALARLPPRQRACLLLSIAGFGGPAIAEQLGLSPPAARMCLARARDAFRKHYYGTTAEEA